MTFLTAFGLTLPPLAVAPPVPEAKLGLRQQYFLPRWYPHHSVSTTGHIGHEYQRHFAWYEAFRDQVLLDERIGSLALTRLPLAFVFDIPMS